MKPLPTVQVATERSHCFGATGEIMDGNFLMSMRDGKAAFNVIKK